MVSKVNIASGALGCSSFIVGVALLLYVGIIDYNNNNGILSDKGANVLFGSLVAFLVAATAFIIASNALLSKNTKDQEVQQSPKEPGVVKKLFRKATERVCSQRDTVAQRT